MKWIKEEYIITYGYYKNNGEINYSDSEFNRALETFRKFQNKDYASAKNDFEKMCIKYKEYENHNSAKSDNLENNSDFKKWILDKNLNLILLEYDNLIKNNNQIKINYKISDYSDERKLENIINIYKDDYERDAEVSYNSKTIRKYLNDIRSDLYIIPSFQRKFVWTRKQIISFLNALNKGYPFGNITVWYPKDKDDPLRKASFLQNNFIEKFKTSFEKDASKKGLIIDGQQRTTSLISLMILETKIHKNRNIIYSFDKMKFKSYKSKSDKNYIEAGDLFNDKINIGNIIKKYQLVGKEKMAIYITNTLREKILKSKIGITIVENSTLDTAINIFSEMNSTGKALSLFDIIHARWFFLKINYDIESYINEWLSDKIYKPDKLTIIKAIYLLFSKNNIQSKEIFKYIVSQWNIKEMSSKIKKSLDMAHNFLIYEMKFQPEIIPSKNIFRFLPYIFYKNNNQKLTDSAIKALKKYVKIICIKNFYSSSTDQKLQQNIEKMDFFFEKEQANDWQDYKETKEIKINHNHLLDLEYNERSSFYLYVLNILFRNAKNLCDNKSIPVHMTNKKTSKINVNYIIPKSISFEGKKVTDINYSNSIINLIPMLEEENKKINNKYPLEYYKMFAYKNISLNETLNKMFIDANFLSSINQNSSIKDVENFWKKRAEKLSNLINDEN